MESSLPLTLTPACHAALYYHTESYSDDRSVKAAVKRLQRAQPALQLKSLKDCPF